MTEKRKVATVSISVSAQFADRAEAQKVLKAMMDVISKLPVNSSVTVMSSNISNLG